MAPPPPAVIEDSDDELQLSSDTLAALQAFMTERDAAQKKFDELKTVAEEQHRAVSMDAFEEDWQQSQFWYHDETATKLAHALLEGTKDGDIIACVSAPTVFVKLRELRAQGKMNPKVTIRLLEYDRRFAVFGDEFVYYDYSMPLQGLPAELKGKCDRVLADPPFLSDECQTKTALTLRWLTKPWTNPPADRKEDRVKIMLSTGERMRELLQRLYHHIGLQVTDFEVKHHKVLANPFLCYSSWETEDETLRWIKSEE